METKGKYLLHIKTGKIHDGENPCHRAIAMAEENRKWSDSIGELVNFFEGDKKGIQCALCFRKQSRR